MIKTILFKSKSKTLVKNSSSGGAFSEIAAYFLYDGGVVYGATIDKDSGVVFHKRIDDFAELSLLRKSKYVFSNTLNTFRQCRDDLLDGKKVFFTGTPCQIASLLLFLKGTDKTNLLTADIVCHGAPDPKYWESYLRFIGAKPPYNIDFRNKQKSWENYKIVINGVKFEYGDNVYMKRFLKNYSLMEMCFTCKYKGDSHVADITLGDAWGVRQYAYDFYDKKGVSLVVLRNKAELVTNILESKGIVREVLFGEAIRFNPSFNDIAEKPKDYLQIKDLSWDEASRIIINKRPRISLRHKMLCVYKDIVDFFGRPSVRNKIGIVSDFDYVNFGNKLQSYAMQTILHRFGFKTYLLTNKDIKIYHPHFLHDKLGIRNFDSRTKQIYKASKKYEKKVFYIKNQKCLKNIKKSKALIFGSDQIWNIDYNYKNLFFNLGSFYGAKIKVPYYSYAASAGKSQIKGFLEEALRYYLRYFDCVSVREQSLKKALCDFGFDVQHVLDPTFLLSKDDWRLSIDKFSKISVPKKRYILIYGLSSTDYSTYFNDLDQEINIINCLDPKSPYYAINQFDFVKLIKESSLVVTDSYHACIFSIIFGIPFRLFNRTDGTDMASRFETLTEMFDIKADKVNCIKDYFETPMFKTRFKKSLLFLEKATRL